MGTLGTFDSFTTARLGIYAAQHGLRVTGNNISNINTAGYTRQRVDQVSFKTGGHDRYASMMDRHVGNGALVTGINQVRDPYLDIRYRTSAADTGYYDTKLSGLQEIAAILDEVGKGSSNGDETTKGDGLLFAQLQDLAEKLRSYGANPTSANDTLVRGAAEALTMMFRDYAGRLEQVRKDTAEDLGKNVEAANGILVNIRNLNKSIRDAELHGDKALELRDERNRQIDALAEYMHIKVEYSMEDVGAGIEVEKLTISLGNSNPDPKVETDSSVLVDGLYATQLSIPEKKPVLNPDYDPAKYNPDWEAPDDDPDAANPTEICRYLYLKNDGTGTNDAADPDIKLVDNDNYTIQLGKLLNIKGEEWKNTKTEWMEIKGKEIPSNATFEIPVSANLADGNAFKILGKDYTVGDAGDISLADAQDPAKFAAFVAGKLNDSGKYSDYDVTSADGKIIFTAKNQGAIGSTGPAAAPSLAVNDPDNTGWITAGNMTCTDPGVSYDKPDPKDQDPPEGVVTDEFGNQVSTVYTQLEGKWFRLTVKTEYTREIALDDNDIHGSLQAQRELLTEEGEFSSEADIAIDENAKTKRGIPYYQKSFDLLAQQLAKQYNALNTGFKIDKDGNYLDGDGVKLDLELAGSPLNRYEPLTAAQKQELIDAGCFTLDEKGEQVADLDRWLKAKGAVPMGGPLFSNNNGGDDITGINASNIDVSHSWSAGKVQVVPKFEVLFADDKNPDGSLDHTTQVTNVNHMISMIDKALVYDPKDIDDMAAGDLLFTGSFNDMFSNMMGVQANDARVTNISLNNSYTTLVSLDSSREGVSGVDLNDEAMNMMQFQKAYSAACRLMTAIDEALDRLINNTGLAGR